MIDDIKSIIENHENQNVEFKSSFRWNHHYKMVDKSIPTVITRTICALLSSQGGGILIIGVSDDKEIIGIEADINSYDQNNKNRGKDRLVADIGDKIRKNIGIHFIDYCLITFHEVDNKEILVIKVNQYDYPVIHLKKELYARVANTTVKLKGQEAQDFLYKHFKYNKFQFNVEYLLFNLVRYFKLIRIHTYSKRTKYYSLSLLSLIFYVWWYVQLYIDYAKSNFYLPLSLVPFTILVFNLNIDLIKSYIKSPKKEIQDYIPSISKPLLAIISSFLLLLILLLMISALNIYNATNNKVALLMLYLILFTIQLILYLFFRRETKREIKYWEHFRESNLGRRINTLKY